MVPRHLRAMRREAPRLEGDPLRRRLVAAEGAPTSVR
jgi:hypothetical protein